MNTNELITEKPNVSKIDNLITSIKSWWTRSKRALSAQNQQVMKAKQTSNKDQTAKNPGVNRGSRGRESGDTSFKDYDIEDGNSTIDGEKGPHKGSKGKGKHGKRKGNFINFHCINYLSCLYINCFTDKSRSWSL